MSKIDIIITTYRNKEKLKRCLSSVIKYTKFVDFSVFLWCNQPDEEVKKVVHDAIYIDDIMFTDRIIPIFNDNNDGSFSSNNNEAASEGSGDYILLLNDDCYVLNESWLLSMQRVLDTDQSIGAVGALLLYADRQTIQHCGVMCSSRTNSLPFHIMYRQPAKKVNNFICRPRYYQAVTGACMLVRRKDYETLNGLSSCFYYGFEDFALCLDIKHKLGKKSLYLPNACLVHDEGISGTFKSHPKIKENIKVLREKYKGKFFNDEHLYLNNINYMVYGKK